MADSIVRLRVESQEYDQKLKRAAEGLQRYADEAKRVGGTLEYVEDETLAFAKAVGTMNTSATNASGKLAEMKKAFTELSMVYKQMSDAEKKSPFGRALSQSIEQLKGRISETSEQLKNVNAELGSNGGGMSKVLDTVAGKFGINISKLGGMGLALGATTAAVKVAKDAFSSSEQNLDAWGQVVQSSKSLYDGFLYALNTGDISGYLKSMDNIVNAAREAYNAMDELKEYNAFNKINVQKARANMTETITDYREGKASKETLRAAGDAYINELRGRQELEAAAYEKAVIDLATKKQVSGSDLLAALSGKYGDYTTLRNLPLSGSKKVLVAGGFTGLGQNVYREEHFAANEQERLGAMLRLLPTERLDALQSLGAKAEGTNQEIASVERQISRVMYGRQYASMGGGSGGAANQAVKLTGEQTAESFGAGFYEGLLKKVPEAIQDVPILSDMEIVDQEAWAAQEKMLDEAKEKMKAIEEEAKKMEETWNLVAGSISTVGGALSGLEDPAAKVAGTILQAVATMALAYAEATAKAAKLGPIAWLGFAATGLATFLAASSSIKQATAGSYATGGIVPGNNYNDGLTANVSSGELILNRAQIGNLASQLQANNHMEMVAVVSGEQLRLVLNNNSRRRGKGEYITTKMSY